MSQDSQPHTVVLSDPAHDRSTNRSKMDKVQPRPDGLRIWSGKDLFGVGVVATAARFTRHSFRPHTHDTLMLGLIVSGTKAFARERDTWIARPGTVSIVNPGELHTGYRVAGDELRYLAVYAPPSLFGMMTERANQAVGTIQFQAGVIEDPEVYRALSGAHQALTRPSTLLAREHLLLRALGRLAGRHGSWNSNHAAQPLGRAYVEVQRVREIVEARYAEDLSITDLANGVGVSPYHLMRQFRRYVGLPIHAYQIQVRVERAKALLASGEKVVDAGLSVGFADQSHFSRRFKDLVGTPPAAYQRDIQA